MARRPSREGALVRWLREGPRGSAHDGGGCPEGDKKKGEQRVVRGLRAEAADLRASDGGHALDAGGGEGAVVLWLREGARGGPEPSSPFHALKPCSGP